MSKFIQAIPSHPLTYAAMLAGAVCYYKSMVDDFVRENEAMLHAARRDSEDVLRASALAIKDSYRDIDSGNGGQCAVDSKARSSISKEGGAKAWRGAWVGYDAQSTTDRKAQSMILEEKVTMEVLQRCCERPVER